VRMAFVLAFLASAAEPEPTPELSAALPCRIASVSASARPDAHWYSFLASCRPLEPGSKTWRMEVTASYVAKDKAFFELAQGIVGGSVWNLRSWGACSADPWKEPATCKTTQVLPSPNAPPTERFQSLGFPLSAGLLTEEQRQEVVRLLSASPTPSPPTRPVMSTPRPGQGPRRITPLPKRDASGAPVVVAPEDRKVYEKELLLRLKPASGSSERQFELDWEFQSSRTGGWENRSVVRRLDVSADPDGILIPFEAFGERGRWRMRARAVADPNSWSDWVTFGLQ
jgi:hypothetical protein